MKLTNADVVLVTGGAQGLGRATVEALLETGAQAVIVDLPGEAGEKAAAELGEKAHFAPADVRDEEQVQAAVDLACSLGTLRAVVNCAGVATPGRIIGKKGVLPLEKYKQVIDINLVGSFNVMRLAVEKMIDNDDLDGDKGVIINTASVAAFDGQVGQAAYASSKGGIVALTLSAARDLADKHIRVMTIAPGIMGTPMMAGMPEETKASLEAMVPHPSRYGKPEEYGQLARHIVENGLLNGETIRLDGALRMPPR